MKICTLTAFISLFSGCIKDSFNEINNTCNQEKHTEIIDPTLKQIQGAKEIIENNKIYEKYPAIQGQWKILESYDLTSNLNTDDIIKIKEALDNIVTLIQSYKLQLEKTNQTIPRWIYEFLLYMNAWYTTYLYPILTQEVA